MTAYIVITIATLAIIAGWLKYTGRSRARRRLSPLASLAMVFTLAGIIFSDDRLVAYSLLGMGILLGVVDIMRSFRRSQTKS